MGTNTESSVFLLLRYFEILSMILVAEMFQCTCLQLAQSQNN